jgi:tetrapyrrole methylase family protein/MazG family protein
VTAPEPRIAELTRLVAIVDRLRDGCPWDREQTLATMAPCAQEEAAEVADAVAVASNDGTGGLADVCEELGDLLMNVLLMSRIAEQARAFDLAEVARRISEKLVNRHPHVFGDAEAKTAGQVLANWDRIKSEERRAKGLAGSRLDGVPERMNALGRAAKLGKKAAKTGFDWPDARGALDKVGEELRELEAAAGESKARAEQELGDLLFAVVNVARKLDLDPDQALRGANARFERRFRHVEARLGERIGQAGLAEMERLWQEAKAAGL